MQPLVLFLGLIFFLMIRYWYVSIPILIVGYLVGDDASKHERQQQNQFRGYDPAVFTEQDVLQNVRIMVPANAKDADGDWPVTIANNANRAYGETTLYVVCTATETVLDGTSNWVMGVKQYPYVLMTRKLIRAKSIETMEFRQASDDMGPHKNLTNCALYTDSSKVASAKENTEDKWISVTPRGRSKSHRNRIYVDEHPTGF